MEVLQFNPEFEAVDSVTPPGHKLVAVPVTLLE
jgi:hypothetical protein